MAEINSYADVIRDWEKVLTSVEQHLDVLPNVETYRQAVVEVLAQAKEAKARQDAAVADRQKATQDLTEIFTRGRDLVVRLRGVVKANLGMRNELLVQFGAAPVRKRSRKLKAPATEPPTTPSTPPSASEEPKA
jgi:hypothetical protein